MQPGYHIDQALPGHISVLGAIELAAAAQLVGHAPPSVLAETMPVGKLEEAQREGRLWVALADETPVGFAIVSMLGPGQPHLAEIDVAPEHGRRGLGTALLRAVCAWAAGAGHDELTLTTFRAVPWNMPFYARFGFEAIPAGQLSLALQAIVQDETNRGMEPDGRVAMRYRLRPAQPQR